MPTAQFQAFLDYINDSLNTALAIPGGSNYDKFFMQFGQEGTPRPRYLKRLQHSRELEGYEWPAANPSDVESFKSATWKQMDDWEARLKLIDNMRNRLDQKRIKRDRAEKRCLEKSRMLKQTQVLLGLKNCQDPTSARKAEGPVFVCVDVEAIERPPNPISEVGIAVLDFERVRDVPPGPCGRDWWPFIKAHHLRTKEYSGLVNYKYIQGCPNAFNFG